ncbi:MAG TPA: hypothetical protein VJV23_07015, partial [Candidatus Polarisedimenticolia bacterium]|nr:hypothetical protein [Candidatus Polarisedimenticolia bacterium]
WARGGSLLLAPAVLAAGAACFGRRWAVSIGPGMAAGAALVLAPVAVWRGPAPWQAGQEGLPAAASIGSRLPAEAWTLAMTMPLVALAPLLLLLPAPRMDRPRRFICLAAALFAGLLAAGPAPADPGWGPRSLLPAVPLMAVAVTAAAARRREARDARMAAALVVVALAAGLAVQLSGLRQVAAGRRSHAAMLKRVERAVAPGDILLTDSPRAAEMLAPLARTRPALYARPGWDLEPLLARLDAAGTPAHWIVQEAAAPASPRPRPGLRLGEGLRLLLSEQEAGARAFMRMPKGD